MFPLVYTNTAFFGNGFVCLIVHKCSENALVVFVRLSIKHIFNVMYNLHQISTVLMTLFHPQ